MGNLSSRALAKLDQPGRYADGDGPYLVVDSKQRRYWQLRYMIDGRRHDMAIGPERHFSPGQARETARHPVPPVPAASAHPHRDGAGARPLRLLALQAASLQGQI